MSTSLKACIKKICSACGNDRTRMMDVVRAVQEKCGSVSSQALDLIAEEMGTQRVEVESVVSFYAFLAGAPRGKTVIRLCNDVVDEMQGGRHVAAVFMEELGIAFGETTPDGEVSLEYTPCIGMSDQAPAALVNDVVVTGLNGEKARGMVQEIRARGAQARLVRTLGDGNNAHPLVNAMVVNNIRKAGPVILAEFESGTALRQALAMTPAEVIRDMKTSRLRGRGGAGFPTGMKWDFARQATGTTRYVLCNADEGEPGTFKDRVILTERPDLMFEGMTIAGYAIGAESGIFYLRAEYAYLQRFLEQVLAERRKQKLLGRNICGLPGFHFDIRIQMGAGAYICGEETALISSCEGLRGDPKNRPPFPAQRGYLGCPTVVNNVETLCCVARILDKGPGWFAQIGAKGSPGTKLLSVSGDCRSPGVYEVPFGISVKELLKMAGAENAAAIQVGGPSGAMIGPSAFGRTICYDDLATGGSIIILGAERNILEVVRKFMEFFVEESCGYCTPCRAGNVLLKNKIDAILAGRAEPADLDYLRELAATIKLTSRCGLGQTSPNPVLTTLQNFPAVYEKCMRPGKDRELRVSFDIGAALVEAQELVGRKSAIFN